MRDYNIVLVPKVHGYAIDEVVSNNILKCFVSEHIVKAELSVIF